MPDFVCYVLVGVIGYLLGVISCIAWALNAGGKGAK